MLALHPSDIELGERRRALSEDAVERLAASMDQIGLRQPITVRVVDEMMVDGHLTAGVPVLVAGAHRLAAAKKLGWAKVDCIEIEGSEIAAELWEISENLHRFDLTREQRDEHIRRFAELLEAQVEVEREQVRQNDAPEKGVPPKQVKGPARRIAEETGISVRTVQRALAPVTVEPVEPVSPEDAETRQFNALMSAWNRAGSNARERFMDEIDTPVMG